MITRWHCIFNTVASSFQGRWGIELRGRGGNRQMGMIRQEEMQRRTMAFPVPAGSSAYSLELLCSLFALPFRDLEQF